MDGCTMLTLAAARALDQGSPNLEFVSIKHLSISTDILKGCFVSGRDAGNFEFPLCPWELPDSPGERLPSIV